MAILSLYLLFTAPVSGQNADYTPKQLEGVGVEEHLGDTIPMDLAFTDHFGNTVTLDKYFDGEKPVVLTLSYYTCPMLCPMILNGLATTADSLNWSPGNDYRIVSVSINPRETPDLAKATREKFAGQMPVPLTSTGWMFHVGKEENIRKLADAVGFQYKYVEANQQYAHPAVYFILSPAGKITRYLYGINQKKKDVRLALVEASEGKIGNVMDKVLLYCCQFDPEAGTYTTEANRVMNLAAATTALLMGSVLGVFWWRERRKHNQSGE